MIVPVQVVGVVRAVTMAETAETLMDVPLTTVPPGPELSVLRLVVGEMERKLLQFDVAAALNVIGTPVLETVMVCDTGGGCPIW